jgi:hypothetical protein
VNVDFFERRKFAAFKAATYSSAAQLSENAKRWLELFASVIAVIN